MEARALHSLELPKVLAYLAGFAVSEAGYKACLALRPFARKNGEAAGDAFVALRREAALFEQGRLFALRSEARLRPFAPVDGLLRFVAAPNAVLDLDDLTALREMLLQGRFMIDALRAEPSAAGEGGWPLWLARCESLPMPARCIAALGRCLAEDGHIRDEASPELALAREELRRLHQQCARKVKDYAAEYNILHFLQDSFMTLSSDRYVLPLKSNFKGRLQGVIHDYSQTGETCYFEPLFLVEINNRLQNLKREEREEERKILVYLSGLAREEAAGIAALSDFLVELDMLFARAALADCLDGRMPDFEEGRGVLLREARHPLLALAASPEARKALRRYELRRRELSREPDDEPLLEESRDLSGGPAFDEESGAAPGRAAANSPVSASAPASGASVVPSTLELLPGHKALIISGGNAGGKTVCLKSLGLIALMAQCCLPVPVASGSFLPPWKRIHAFIGDEQSLDDHVSTFTAQIRHISRIWPELGPDCLVILDEFGAGTDPSQGAALAQALVDGLMESGAFVTAATHFPALKAYALSTSGVRAASVLFDPRSGKPLFRLVYDQVGASRALDVAKEHGLPPAVLRRAEQYLLVSGEDSSALIERLNALAVQREAELAALDKEKKAFAEKKHRLEERFEAERRELFDSVRDEARQILKEWKSSRVSHKQALKKLAETRSRLLAPEEAGPEGTRPALDLTTLTPRQRLRHIPWKRVGVLLESDVRKNRVRLDFDGVSLWADASDVELPDQVSTGAAQSPAFFSGGRPGASSLPLRLDLRGMRADVAISELESFLDKAILSGREQVEILHGRGTGALRREVHGFLKRFPAARDFRLAPEDQGGDGVTFVELQ